MVQKRDPPQLSKPELVRLVHWKVGLRGKWRPRLHAFAEALPDEQVEIATRKGFKALGSSTPTNASVKEALTIITALKVGGGRAVQICGKKMGLRHIASGLSAGDRTGNSECHPASVQSSSAIHK